MTPTPIFLELKSMSKASKKTPMGIEEVKYSCVLKGNKDNIQVILTLKSESLEELNDLVKQYMGNIVKVSIENISKEQKQEE